MEWPPSGAGWRQTNRMGEKMQLLVSMLFPFLGLRLHAKNLLWLNCRSRFFYRLRQGLGAIRVACQPVEKGHLLVAFFSY